MFNKQQHRGAVQSVFMSSVQGFANTVAVAITFFAVPPAYDATIAWVLAFTARYYSTDFVNFVGFAWFVLISFLIFFLARASTSTLLVMGGLTIAVRFL